MEITLGGWQFLRQFKCVHIPKGEFGLPNKTKFQSYSAKQNAVQSLYDEQKSLTLAYTA